MKTLSEREMQVAELLAWGLVDKEVAEELFVSFDTVRTHRRNIYSKLGTRNASDLTRWYFQETQGYSFGPSPKIRFAISVFFILLAFSMEYLNLTAIRVQSLRTASQTVMVRKGKGRKIETYQFA